MTKRKSGQPHKGWKSAVKKTLTQPVCTEDDGSREPVYPAQIEKNEAMAPAVTSHQGEAP